MENHLYLYRVYIMLYVILATIFPSSHSHVKLQKMKVAYSSTSPYFFFLNITDGKRKT